MANLQHHRTRDHFGTQGDDVVVLSSAIGGYAAGTTVHAVLVDLVARLAGSTSTNTRVATFTANAQVGWCFRANAVITTGSSGGRTGSFTANAVIVSHQVTFTGNAVIRRTQAKTATADAYLVL